MNLTSLPDALTIIVTSAFSLQAGIGGFVGALLAGVQRATFSNEAGLGSAPNVAATADVRHPISQGITQSFSVFIDTIIICTCTALVILMSDVYEPGAAIDGVVLSDNFRQGQRVEAGDALMELADEDSLWVEARLSPGSQIKLTVGSEAHVKVGGELFAAVVAQEAHTIDPVTRTRIVRLVVSNAAHRLHPVCLPMSILSLRPIIPCSQCRRRR